MRAPWVSFPDEAPPAPATCRCAGNGAARRTRRRPEGKAAPTRKIRISGMSPRKSANAYERCPNCSRSLLQANHGSPEFQAFSRTRGAVVDYRQIRGLPVRMRGWRPTSALATSCQTDCELLHRPLHECAPFGSNPARRQCIFLTRSGSRYLLRDFKEAIAAAAQSPDPA